MSKTGFDREWLAKNHPEAFKELIGAKTPPTTGNEPGSDVAKPKPSKYRNQKTEADGIKFDSKKEAKKYYELKLLEKAGEITELKLQVEFPLICDTLIVNEIPVKLPYKIMKAYIADFTFIERGKFVCLDVKGCVLTREFRLKRRLMKFLYNIEITEV